MTEPQQAKGAATVLTFEELRAAAGRDLGVSDWLEVDQLRIDGFADATDDHQWIHVDAERAATTEHGGTIAHGYLTLSCTGARLGDLLQVEGASSMVNYGLDRVRFPAPLPSGRGIRTHATIAAVMKVTGGLQVSARLTTQAQGIDKPVCVADVQIRYLH